MAQPTGEQPPATAMNTAPGEFQVEAPSFLSNLFQPGVGSGTHRVLQTILVMLNIVLLGSAIAGINSPHSTVMFILSIGLTASYFWFMIELAKSSRPDEANHIKTS